MKKNTIVAYTLSILFVLSMILLVGCTSSETEESPEETAEKPPKKDVPVESTEKSAEGQDEASDAYVPGTNGEAIVQETDLAKESTDVFEYQKTINVVPDETYRTGGFCRMMYVPERDSYMVTFGALPFGEVQDVTNKLFGLEAGKAYVYKEYSLDLETTGYEGEFKQGGTDSASIHAEDNGKWYYYFLIGSPPPDKRVSDKEGWSLIKYDPVNWSIVDETRMELNYDPTQQMQQIGGETANDQMLGYANGYLFAGSVYQVNDPETAGPEQGEGTFYFVYTPDLTFVQKLILKDVPHINGGSIIYANGAYHVVTSSAFFGDVLAMHYDDDWNFIDSQTLVEDGQWSEGVVYDEENELYYIAYLGHLERRVNVHLAAFDKDWNLVSSTLVTSFDEDDPIIKEGGRPYLLLHEKQLFVLYDVATFSGDEHQRNWQCYVSEYAVE